MKFRPLHDRVVVRRIEEDERTKGGIIIPDTAKEKPQQGEIVAVGPGAPDEKGKVQPLDVTEVLQMAEIVVADREALQAHVSRPQVWPTSQNGLKEAAPRRIDGSAAHVGSQLSKRLDRLPLLPGLYQGLGE